MPKRRCKGAFCLKTAAALDSLSAAQESPLEELLPAGLPERNRQVLLWRYGQIAIRLGISEVACRSRISRALARCRSVFKNIPPGPERIAMSEPGLFLWTAPGRGRKNTACHG